MSSSTLKELPIKCPICNNPLINEYIESSGNITILFKKCSLKINHSLMIRSSKCSNYMDWICIRYDNINVVWYYPIQSVLCNKLSSSDSIITNSFIPWFEPDFSDFKKLKEKIKTYLVFS